jgi:hypothetical protein
MIMPNCINGVAVRQCNGYNILFLQEYFLCFWCGPAKVIWRCHRPGCPDRDIFAAVVGPLGPTGAKEADSAD